MCLDGRLYALRVGDLPPSIEALLEGDEESRPLVPPSAYSPTEASTQSFLAAMSRDGARLLRKWARQLGFDDHAADRVSLCVRDAPQRQTHVSLVDLPLDGKGLLHPAVPVQERLGVGDLHDRVNPLRHPAKRERWW